MKFYLNEEEVAHATVNPVKILAYHGSQSDKMKIEDRLLYLTDDKDMAIDFARGYCFNYDLMEGEKPTLYTIKAVLNNPKYIYTEDEYEELMDMVNENAMAELEQEGYDGIIYLPKEDYLCNYFLLFHPLGNAQIIEQEYVGDDYDEVE